VRLLDGAPLVGDTGESMGRTGNKKATPVERNARIGMTGLFVLRATFQGIATNDCI